MGGGGGVNRLGRVGLGGLHQGGRNRQVEEGGQGLCWGRVGEGAGVEMIHWGGRGLR